MKGLIRKDIYMILRNFRSFLFIAAFFIVLSAFGSSNMFLTMYPMVFAAILPVSLLSYDDSSRWSAYCDAMPCTRAQVVSVKYVVALICMAVVFVLSALAQLLHWKFAGGSRDELVFLLLSLLLLGLAGSAISLPAIFKLGVEKGRIIYYFVLGASCALTFLFSPDSSGGIHLPMLALTAGAAVLFALSWLLSIALYKKRSL